MSGLSADEAAARLARVGHNTLAERRRSDAPALLLRQFTSPIILILIAAALLSLALHDPTDGAIIVAIVVVSGLLGFWHERGATTAVEKLLETVELKTTVLRAGQETALPTDELVPGDFVLLSAGDGVPADCRLLAARDLFVDQSTLTGESYPVEKRPGVVAPHAPLAQRDNVLLLGTHVVSGRGRAVVVRTARATEFGTIAARLRLRAPETEFEHGVRRFGSFLLEVTLVLVIAIFACNVYLARPFFDSFARHASERVLFHAYLNAAYETAFANPIDEARRRHRAFDLSGWHKLDEVPYDFARKRLSVLVEHDGEALLVTKGAVRNVLEACTATELADGGTCPLDAVRPSVERQFTGLSAQGYRTLGVAIRRMGSQGRSTVTASRA